MRKNPLRLLQSLALGTTFWSLFHDLFPIIKQPEGVEVKRYADNRVVITSVVNKKELMEKKNKCHNKQMAEITLLQLAPVDTIAVGSG
ncbi:hypothetical protein JTB14_037758 [Gonioctena quinquepunctata]|nr:hypothetical protein JTB14_037758 [Gonioctena quinquepunctata]